MKLVWKITLAVACCGVVGLATYAIIRPKLTVEATLPDVSVLGVDIEDFTYSGVYTQEIGIGYEWIDDTSEKPSHQWSKYENADGAYLVFDEHNRLRWFVNSYDKWKAQVSPDDVLTADALTDKATAIINELVINSSEFSFDAELSTINTTKAYVAFTRSISDYALDITSVELLQDGTVKRLGIDYCDVSADFTPTKMDAIVEQYLTETVVPRYRESGYDPVECGAPDAYFVTIGDKVYGAYSVTVTLNAPDSVYDAIGVVVCDE